MMGTRFGFESNHDKTLNLDFWLTIGRNSGYSHTPSVKVTAGYPSLARNERALNLKIKLPLALFETPSLSATIKVDSPSQAVHIDAETIAEAVRQSIGMDVDIQVVRPEE
jgi:hypothetical protein